MDENLLRQLRRILAPGSPRDPSASLAPEEDAQRLWQHISHYVRLGLIDLQQDGDALELACYAIQLPALSPGKSPAASSTRLSLEDRAQRAIELLVTHRGGHITEDLLQRTVHILEELPRRSTAYAPARLLADVLNLDDFGLTGLTLQAMQLARQGQSLRQVIQRCEKREQYGYWDARLKDSFHFEPIRQAARRRLTNARQALQILLQEMQEDKP